MRLPVHRITFAPSAEHGILLALSGGQDVSRRSPW